MLNIHILLSSFQYHYPTVIPYVDRQKNHANVTTDTCWDHCPGWLFVHIRKTKPSLQNRER